MSSEGDEHAALGFIKTLFGFTTESVYVCSLANDKGDSAQAPERSICDRDADAITIFLNRWDRAGRGCYFSLSTFKAGARRQKPNAVEFPAFPTDIDFKSILEDQETVDRVLSSCRLLPSAIVYSGHGRHPYWILKEPLPTQEHLERIEAVQRQLADVFGGDLAPAHVVALMRLPGTHNTKGGQWLDVAVSYNADLRYELDELEEWLAEQSPLLKRKVRPKPPEQDPYTSICEAMGFKPPTDVEQRLTAMVYQGAGDAAIHSTQLAVTSSLVSRGYDLDQVVTTVLDATRIAAGEYGTRWNWRREENNIRRMCQTWLSKIETRARASTPSRQEGVVTLASAREARAQAAPKPQPAPVEDKSKKFHRLAAATLLGLRARGEDLLFEGGLAWRYADGVWKHLLEPREWLEAEIEQSCRRLAMMSDTRLINETRNFIMRNPDLKDDNPMWDRHGLVPAKNGLINPVTLELLPARPEQHVTWCLTCDYVPGAICPTWLRMLDDAFADRTPDDRAAIIATLQEVLGAALVDRKPRGLRRALVLVGGTKSGKSQLLEVFGGLFGERISQSIGAVEGTHGLMPFRQRRPWILDEAFAQNVWHVSSTVKTLVTGEEIPINLKHGPVISHRFTGPIFWGTNHPPSFKESTRAIIDRLVVINCEQLFNEREPRGVALEARLAGLPGPAALVLSRETPGILVWALEGLQRALDRGQIQVPQESEAAAAQIYRDSNLVAGFVEECLELDPDGRISLPDLCVAVSCWFAENKGENRSLPSNDSIGRALVALHNPCLVTDRYELRDMGARYLVGAKLNSHGLDYHQRGVEADLFEGKTVNTTSAGGVVNKPIPGSWDVKPKVIAMRIAHAKHAEKTQKEVSCGGDTSSVTDRGGVESVSSEVSPTNLPDPSRDPLF